MSYFTAQQHADVAATPSSISAVWATDSARFVSDLGAPFSAEIAEHIKLAFCAVFAYDHVPYGPDGGSAADQLETLMAKPNMDCDNYAAVAWGLFELLCPSPTTSVCAIGWDGGYIGNHAQIVAHKIPSSGGNGGGSILVDPTVGFVQCAYNFDWYASGKPCSSTYAKSFNHGRADGSSGLNTAVMLALSNGYLKPSDILYVFGDRAAFVSPPVISAWATPALCRLRIS